MQNVVLLSVVAPTASNHYKKKKLTAVSYYHRYRRCKIDCSSLFTVPATSAAQNSLLFFFFLLRQLTKLTFITRQAVCAVKQSIFLRCLWLLQKEKITAASYYNNKKITDTNVFVTLAIRLKFKTGKTL